ncbi:MAG TPA: hypothetical protein VEC92_00055 [Nitrososphaerales archaeon]|nr:hypothetical protein [Nitrososphaerales archaeon]
MNGSGAVAGLLAPVLDTYADAAVGLIGCRSTGLSRESCEYDLLLVRPERNPPATLRIGETFVDLAFSTEGELVGDLGPEATASLAFLKPVRDRDLILSSSSSAARESFEKTCQRCADERLALSVKGMGRAEEAVSGGGAQDADFWLVSAGYDLAYAWLYASGTIPAPSHLLSQMRELSRGRPGIFEAVSNATGLTAGSRTACEGRLDALALIYDLTETPSPGAEAASPGSVRAAYELLRRKAMATLQVSQPVESFCFLGLEMTRRLPQILKENVGRRETSEIVSSLSGEEGGLLAQSVVRALRIGRPVEMVEKGLEGLRGEVSALARRT